jgi:hypothetical protein
MAGCTKLPRRLHVGCTYTKYQIRFTVSNIDIGRWHACRRNPYVSIIYFGLRELCHILTNPCGMSCHSTPARPTRQSMGRHVPPPVVIIHRNELHQYKRKHPNPTIGPSVNLLVGKSGTENSTCHQIEIMYPIFLRAVLHVISCFLHNGLIYHELSR